jgi:RNA polymerase sigma-70 factor (ECF subfamily)
MDEVDRRRRLEALFSTHAGAVRAYAVRRTGDTASADDVVSDVFVVVWRRLDDVPADALPWLLGCARRIIGNQRRSARRHAALVARLVETGGADGSVGSHHPGADRALGEALQTLRERDREVLLLVAWEGLDARRAAAVIGCSERAFAMRLHRAREKLAAALGRVEPKETPAMEAVR